jgi:hypothetical protein
MKYAILFAATAAASDAYGGYGAAYSSPAEVSSTPAASGYGGYGYQSSASSKTSSHASSATPCSTSVGSNGYTTVVPGYGKTPVTVTAQHQAYPTCVAVGYDGKSCEKWGDDKYVSTTITDYNKNVVTVTKAQECVTVYQEKKTITHYATPTAGSYGAVSTPVAKNATGTWYELYEKVYVIEYENMGKNALPGYPGSGLCHKCDDDQPLTIKEYKGGKWTEEKKTFSYGKPKDDVKVYEKPGVYTIPAKDVTVYKTTPAGKAPEPVVYHYDEKVVTITKANEPYTCTYEAPKQTPASKTPSKGEEYPSTVTKTPTYNDYGYKASSTPKKPENDYPSYPSYPSKSNTTSYGNGYESSSSKPVYGASSVPSYDNGYGYNAKSTPTPASSSKPVYGDNGYGASSTPTPPAYNNGYGGDYKPSSTPCESDKYKSTPTPAEYKPSTPSAPAYEAPAYKPSAPVYDASKPSSTPVYEAPAYTPSAPAYEAPAYKPSAPVYDASKPSPTPVYEAPAYKPSAPVYPAASPAYPAASPAYPASGSSAGAYGNTYAKRSSLNERRKVVV